MAGVEAYVHAKFHLDPSNHFDTNCGQTVGRIKMVYCGLQYNIIHQRHRQTGQDRTDRADYDPIGYGELFYKRSPKKVIVFSAHGV